MSPRPPPAHRATTAHLRAVYPFAAAGRTAASGTYVGREVLGGPFFHDPWELYRAGLLTNPNLVVAGQIGRGKSTFVKTFVWRQLAYGRQAWIVDPKGEYGPLAEAAGCRPVHLSPGGSVRLNPLEQAPASSVDDPVRHPVELCCAIAESGLARPLSPAERTATDLAVRSAARSDLPSVIEKLFQPDREMAAAVRTGVADLAADGRSVALELRRLVHGDLAGMFDASVSSAAAFEGPVVVLDLSSLYDSPALGVLITCAVAWLHGLLRRRDPVKRLVVVDEAWAVLHDIATARWLQSSFKLSRAFGVANVAVIHRLSDLSAAGDRASAQRLLAEGLLADSESRVIFGQSPAEIDTARAALALTATEARLIQRLPRGIALWKVGERSSLVELVVGPSERRLVDTDAAMRPAGDRALAPAAGEPR